ncbi:hypothetical protein ACP4CF_003429 [Klebsiella pneumoniae]
MNSAFCLFISSTLVPRHSDALLRYTSAPSRFGVCILPSAILKHPAAAVNLNGIGSNLADTTPFAGRFYRARIDDLTLVSKTALQVIEEEMAAVTGRFS